MALIEKRTFGTTDLATLSRYILANHLGSSTLVEGPFSAHLYKGYISAGFRSYTDRVVDDSLKSATWGIVTAITGIAGTVVDLVKNIFTSQSEDSSGDVVKGVAKSKVAGNILSQSGSKALSIVGEGSGAALDIFEVYNILNSMPTASEKLYELTIQAAKFQFGDRAVGIGGGANSYIYIDPNKANANNFGEKPDVATVDTFLNNAFANLAGYFNYSLETMSLDKLKIDFEESKDYILNIINTNFYANPVKK